jgi:hypothetical protein
MKVFNVLETGRGREGEMLQSLYDMNQYGKRENFEQL